MAVYIIKNEGGVKIDTGTSGNGLILPVVPSSSSLSGAGETGSLFYSEADGKIYAYGASGWSPNIGETGAAGETGTSGSSGTSGAGGSSPTYFTYNAGTLSWTTSFQTITIPTEAITVDNTRKFQVDFWGSTYYPSDFFGEMMNNQGAFYGQPVFRWTDDWEGTKVAVVYGSANNTGGMQARINYSGAGNQLQLQYKANGALTGIQLNIFGTLTYL